MRAIAVLLVMAFHAGIEDMQGGFLGVDLFFALSGYLISTLLIREWDLTGSLHLKAFYVRRARRLYPALALVVVAVLIYTLTSGFLESGTLKGLPFVLLYVGNWARANGFGLGLLGHTWTLAIEEQFYIVWPAVVLTMLVRGVRRRTIALLLAGAATFEAGFRGLLWELTPSQYRVNSWMGLFTDTDTHSTGLILGSALAFFLASRQGPVRHPVALRCAAAAAAATVGWIIATTVPNTGGLWDGELFAFEVCSAVVVAGLVLAPVRAPALIALLSVPAYLGRISYGVYLWDYPLSLVLGRYRPFNHSINITLTSFMVVPIVFASLSYHFVEVRFLKRGRNEAGIARHRQAD